MHKLKIVPEHLNEVFERTSDPKKTMNIGIRSIPMKQRSPEFKSEDMEKAKEFLLSTGLVDISHVTDIQKRNFTLKFETKEPIYYWSNDRSSYGRRDPVLLRKKMYYLIQGDGYLRKDPPGSDRLQVVTKEPFKTYREIAEIAIETVKKDIKKSESIRLNN